MGNSKTISATTHCKNRADTVNFYATDPKAVELLLEQESFNRKIWEPACGAGHISEVLKKHGHFVLSTDLYDHGYGGHDVDFLDSELSDEMWGGDIITNPPYKRAREFVEEALRLVHPGAKVAMFLRLTFLESVGRRELFRTNPPMTVYVSSARLQCGRNGVFDTEPSAVAYCWIVWRKGYTGTTELKWIN